MLGPVRRSPPPSRHRCLTRTTRAPRRAITDAGRRPAADTGEDEHLALRRAGALGRPPADRRGGGLRGADARPGTGDPPDPGRKGRARRRPDRHRQDGGVHPADPRPPPAVREHVVLARAAPGPVPRADTDPRARGPGLGGHQDLWPQGAAPCDGRVRRGAARPADQGAAGGCRDPGRHTGPAARPRRAARRQPDPGRDPRPRRGRPDAGHGLHARHPPHPRPAAEPQAEPAVLGHLLGRDQAARGLDPRRTRRRSRSRATAPPPKPSGSSSTRSIGIARRSSSPTSSSRATGSRCSCSRARS